MLEKVLVQIIDDDNLPLKEKLRHDRQGDNEKFRMSFWFPEQNYHLELPMDTSRFELAQTLKHVSDMIYGDIKQERERARELPEEQG